MISSPINVDIDFERRVAVAQFISYVTSIIDNPTDRISECYRLFNQFGVFNKPRIVDSAITSRIKTEMSVDEHNNIHSSIISFTVNNLLYRIQTNCEFNMSFKKEIDFMFIFDNKFNDLKYIIYMSKGSINIFRECTVFTVLIN